MTGQNVPQLTHVANWNMQMCQNNYKQLPSSIKQVVAVMHHQQHYAVMVTTIAINLSMCSMVYLDRSLIGKTT